MQKFKIVPRSSLPSEEEVDRLKSFDHILARHQAANGKKWWLKAGVGAFLLLIISVPVVFLNLPKKALPFEGNVPIDIAVKKPTPVVEKNNSGSAIAVLPAEKSPSEKQLFSDEGSPASVNPKDSQPSQPQRKPESALEKKKPGKVETVNLKKKESQVVEKTEAISAQLTVFTEAVPEDGYPALHRYFTSELKYPENAKAENKSGVVVVSFFIDQQGKAQEIQVEQSLGEEFDVEAMRLVRLMPRWKPALANDLPVKTKLSIPIKFSLLK